ncbi:MAG: hypothetical protein JWP11_1295 [Frankiales bacterium]|nr:hypothetical protein [Frankiales bacterium]
MKLRIRNNHLHGWAAHVEVDGIARTDVLSIDLHVDAVGITTAALTVVVDELEVDLPAEVTCQPAPAP